MLRTNEWDPGISAMAGIARACCASGDFVIVTDETKAHLSVEPYVKLSNTGDCSSLLLPKVPRSQDAVHDLAS